MKERVTKQVFDDFQGGAQDAFRKVMSCYGALVFSIVRHIVKTEADAEEITQDVLFKCWTHRQNIQSHDKLKAYICRIAKNEALNFLRRMYSKPDKVALEDENWETMGSLMPDVESEYQHKELQLRLAVAVQQLPEQRRRVFQLSRLQGLNQVEIAEEMGLSPVTVSRHLSIALDDLRKVLLVVAILLYHIWSN